MIVINPGSGPVEDATEAQAALNIIAFVQDLNDQNEHGGVWFARRATMRMDDDLRWTDTEGRWTWIVINGADQHAVEMPGLPLALVRYIGAAAGQNPWEFPRLFVDGSSWLWCFAVDAILSPEDEESE